MKWTKKPVDEEDVRRIAREKLREMHRQDAERASRGQQSGMPPEPPKGCLARLFGM